MIIYERHDRNSSSGGRSRTIGSGSEGARQDGLVPPTTHLTPKRKTFQYGVSITEIRLDHRGLSEGVGRLKGKERAESWDLLVCLECGNQWPCADEDETWTDEPESESCENCPACDSTRVVREERG